MAKKIRMTLTWFFQKRAYLLHTTLVCISIFAPIFLSACFQSQHQIVVIEPGMPSPDFTLPIVRGGSFKLKDLQGQVVLLSFINTQAEADLATPDPSRAQIVFLKSMYEQYSSTGLTVLMVDATKLQTGKHPDMDELINFTYNWQLDEIPVLIDEDAHASTQFGIPTLPTTFLIGKDGLILQRWDNVASSPQLALAIEAILGPPSYRATATNSTSTTPVTSCPGELPGRAKFSGLGLARSLSEDIWAVDQGQPWGANGNYPLQWIVLDNSDKAKKSQLHLQVTGNYFNSESFLLIDKNIEMLPEVEARGLLNTTSSDPSNIYLLSTTITLDQPGCLYVQAVVTDQINGTILYEGEMLVSVN